jgi:hypothetical protein
MAMAANRVADTSRLAEARRAELDWDAGKESVIASGNKRGFQESRQFTRPAGLSPADWLLRFGDLARRPGLFCAILFVHG